MTGQDIALLTEAMQRRLSKTSLAFHRSLYGEIEWADRLPARAVNAPVDAFLWGQF